MPENIIETRGLTVYYGHQRGIIDIDLQVCKGEIFGFLGPNGSGKTTAQRVLMNVIRPTRGTASVFGQDCQKQGFTIRKDIGYLPGELSLYPGMRADTFLNLMASLRGLKIDQSYLRQLYDRLRLDPSRKIKTYSHGNKQKVGVIAAFMSKPELLVLDEPTAALDPIMQQVIMDLMRETKQDGRTVFVSSHILPEVQAVCDRVGMIREGRLIKTDWVESLTHQQFKRIRFRFRESPPENAFDFEGVRETQREGKLLTLEIDSSLDKVMTVALRYGIEDIETLPVTLEEIFLTYYDQAQTEAKHA